MSHREPKKEAKQKSNQDRRPHILHNEEVLDSASKNVQKGVE